MHTSIYKKYPLKEKNELFSKENWNIIIMTIFNEETFSLKSGLQNTG